jgi:hypothetical protein
LKTLLNKFLNFFKEDKPHVEWYEFSCSVRHVITMADLAPGSNDKIDIPYTFRYDPMSDTLQYVQGLEFIKKARHERGINWKDDDINKYKNAVLTVGTKQFDIFQKIEEIKKEHFEKYKGEYRDNSIEELLKNV